jgi:hypothetical protein
MRFCASLADEFESYRRRSDSRVLGSEFVLAPANDGGLPSLEKPSYTCRMDRFSSKWRVVRVGIIAIILGVLSWLQYKDASVVYDCTHAIGILDSCPSHSKFLILWNVAAFVAVLGLEYYWSRVQKRAP